MTKKSLTKSFRLFLYLFVGVIFSVLLCRGTLAMGYFPFKEMAAIAVMLSMLFAPPYFYKRTRNGTGALRGLELGPKWQFQEYLKRQPKIIQVLYRGIYYLRVACLGAILGGFLSFISIAFGFSAASIAMVVMGWFVAAFAWPLWWMLNGLGTLVVRAGNFPKELLIGKREFVIGRKAIWAGISRLLFGLLLIIQPLQALYLVYLVATGRFAEIISQSFNESFNRLVH